LLFYFTRIILVFKDIIYVIIILYSCHLATYEHFMCVYEINDPGHTCDEFLVLFTKSGMTEKYIVSLIMEGPNLSDPRKFRYWRELGLAQLVSSTAGGSLPTRV
jgi:hypothetical protein